MNTTRYNFPLGIENQSLQDNLSERLVSAVSFVNNPRALLLGAPLPVLHEIPAGFDAIFQFRSDLLEQYLRRNVANTVGNLQTGIDYDVTNLSQPVWNEIKRRILNALLGREGGSTSYTLPNLLDPGLSNEEVLEAYLDSLTTLPLRITVNTPKIAFDLANQPVDDVEVCWRITVEVLVPEFSGTTSTGTGTPTGTSFGLTTNTSVGLGIPTIPTSGTLFPTVEFTSILLTWGEAVTSARHGLDTLASKYQVTARLDFSNTVIQANPLDDYFTVPGPVVIEPDTGAASNMINLFGALLDHDNQLLDAIHAAFAPLVATSVVNITPPMALGGLLWPQENLQGLGNFQTRAVVTQGNLDLVTQVLSICINVGNGGAQGDLGLVRPFVADQNYAYYVSESIVRAVMVSRWARPLPSKQYVFTNVDVPIIDEDGNEVIGQATIGVRFLNLFQVTIVPRLGSPVDPIELTGDYEIELRELWYNRKDISDEDQIRPLKTPQVLDFALHLFPFQTQSSANQPAVLLQAIGLNLLYPLYYPTTGPLQLSVRGRTSSPLAAVFIRGNVILPSPINIGG